MNSVVLGNKIHWLLYEQIVMKDFIYHSILNFISREHGFFYINDLVVGRICNQGGRGKVVVVKCFKSKLAYWYKLSIWLRVDCASFFGLMFF